MVLLFPYLGFADNWKVINTNKAEYPRGFILQETDVITIYEDEYLVIRNTEKKQGAIIIIPGEKTVRQAIEEAKELEQERRNRNEKHLGEPIYLLFKYSDYIHFWIE
jgi:hypothetical protein